MLVMAQPIWRGRLSDASKRTSREHHVTLWSLVGLVPGLHLKRLAWPRTYRARRHSLTSGAGLWPWPQ
jgi:hypothetical protein